MKTMFLAPENTKKRFQKPNILRKRPKPPPKPSISVAHESLGVKSLVTTTSIQEPKLQLEKITLYKQCQTKNIQPVQRLILENNVDSGISSIGELYQIDGNVETDRSLAVTCDVLTNSNEDDVFETPINVESFINNSEMEQLVTQADVESELSSRMKQEWCLDFINDAQEIIIEDIDGSHLGSLRLASPAVVNASPLGVTSSPEQTHTSAVPTQNITLEYMNCTTNFKCDIQTCTKRFRSEAALNKHKNAHSKGAKVSNKSDKPVSIECPVKKVTIDGNEEPCGVFCSSKKEIVNHLNEAHDPEDAMYICSECGRRFYWQAGLRAHGRSHGRAGGGAGAGAGAGAGGDAWRCSWAGCSRAFRQPCRLREHMRAHTGDRPYPCQYPNCGWSFRTASKLLRHARRHTGERRHECEQCGRAFRRREHLRDHAARHHAGRLKHACTSTGCQKTFNSSEALKNHTEKVHNEELVVVTSAAAVEADMPPIATLDLAPRPDETYLVSLSSPVLSAVETESLSSDIQTEAVAELSLQEGVTGVSGVTGAAGEPRAARTHCTWPFAARADSPHVFEEDANHEYVLEEDVQVEMSEGSESNIYTIKSDLFLHGNVLNNEDSEQMCSAGEGEGAAAGAGERLLDAHPTSGLMQEELMYTDAAVDESSFRVFLLSGDELS